MKGLKDIQRKVLKDKFNIEYYVYIPSIFSENQLIFDADPGCIKISKQNEYCMDLVSEIDKRILGNKKNSKRALLVFFESEESLEKFFKSDNFQKYRNSCRKLTERLTMLEKNQFIKNATRAGNISLLTKSFGRGTDFIVLDDEVEVVGNGGVHVIQTFFSDDEAEEIQIKGRTARQGEQGSYSMILSLESLEKFDYTEKNFDVLKGLQAYKYLLQNRDKNFSLKYKDLSSNVEALRNINEKSQEYLEKLLSGNVTEILKPLLTFNKGSAVDLNCRTLCLMDATGSMSSLLNKAKAVVNLMFHRVKKVLIDQGVDENIIEIQFVAYRNYNSSPEEILQKSSWETRPEKLSQFLDTVKPQGGMGNEAIEVALQYANKMHRVTPIRQILLIGDADPNTKEEVKGKRTSSLFDWDKQGGDYSIKTYYEEEIIKLDKGVKIHTFYLIPKVKDTFEKISNSTGGSSTFLDVTDQVKGTEILTDTFTSEILRDAGDAFGVGDRFLNYYKEKLSLGYF